MSPSALKLLSFRDQDFSAAHDAQESVAAAVVSTAQHAARVSARMLACSMPQRSMEAPK